MHVCKCLGPTDFYAPNQEADEVYGHTHTHSRSPTAGLVLTFVKNNHLILWFYCLLLKHLSHFLRVSSSSPEERLRLTQRAPSARGSLTKADIFIHTEPLTMK